MADLLIFHPLPAYLAAFTLAAVLAFGWSFGAWLFAYLSTRRPKPP